MGTKRSCCARIKVKGVPVVTVVNKIDLHPDDGELVAWAREQELPVASVSAVTRDGLELLKQAMIKHAPAHWAEPDHSRRSDPPRRHGGDVHPD